MERSDLLRLLSLILVLVVVVAVGRWPGLNYRKYDWRLFKSSGKKKK
ncbi:MAG: hypothetical protein ACP59X_10060 [Solidesulfovibrio sp. DCME]